MGTLTQLQQLHVEHLEHDGLGLGAIQQLVGQGNLFDSLLVVENYPDNQFTAKNLVMLRFQNSQIVVIAITRLLC